MTILVGHSVLCYRQIHYYVTKPKMESDYSSTFSLSYPQGLALLTHHMSQGFPDLGEQKKVQSSGYQHHRSSLSTQ